MTTILKCILRYGVMVAPNILAVVVEVRVLLSQQNNFHLGIAYINYFSYLCIVLKREEYGTIKSY